MQIIKLLYRKMWNNKWLTLSLLTGLILAVALSTSIPIYTDGSLKRLLDKEIRDETTGLSAGALVSRYQTVSGSPPTMEEYEAIDDYYRESVPHIFGLGIKERVQMVGLRPGQVLPVDRERVNPGVRRQISLDFYTNFEENITITNGQLYSKEVKNGVIEAIVTEQALFTLDFNLGDEFFLHNPGGAAVEPLRVKVVGTYEPNLEKSNYWFMGANVLDSAFIIDESIFLDYILKEREIPFSYASWYYDFQMADITMSKAVEAIKKLEALEVRSNQLLPYTQVTVSFMELLRNYRAQGLQLQTLLFTLAAPILVLVLYYIVMTSRQALERQKGEIALLRSRGGSTFQIFWIYLMEGLLLGGIAMLIGPFMGLYMAKAIGASDGFLLFVNRQPLQLSLYLNTYLYGLVAVSIALIATILPALSAAKSSIVNFKQQSARSVTKPIWQRLYLDVLLLGVAAYGWYMFQERQITLHQTGLSSEQVSMHPLLFFVPSIFLFACGLILLRIFPLLMAIFSKIGKRYASIPMHLTFLQVSRSSKQYHPIMLLLILTIGLGIYSSSAARTIDANAEERLHHQYGTDVILQSIWEQELVRPPSGPPTPRQPGQPGQPGQPPGQGEAPPQGRYVEPPFEVYKSLPGVEHAARVFIDRGNASVGGKSLGNGMIMGIDVEDFAHVGWFKREILPGHQNLYLNALGQEESALIVSQQAAERHGLQIGDGIRLTVNRTSVDFTIYAIIPYWPTFYPNEMPFYIGNLNYIQNEAPLAPYEVWLKMEEDALVTPIVEKLAEENIYLVYTKDVRNEIKIAGQHPTKAGVSGILSLGFLVAVAVTLAGFVLYWFFALQSRTVQFGVLRAMGISKNELLRMLFSEQIMTAGFAVILGVALGQIASRLFLPFLDAGQDITKQVPPFHVVFEQGDLNRLYIVILFMILIGAGMLLFRIGQLRISQAVKLGEER
jgi:putative ABC transport system permease protein